MLRTDVVVAGLGLGAIAAALAIADHGLKVVMAGPESRIGGQVTTQLTSPLDEHPLIETTGCTTRYRAFRDALRAEYGDIGNPGGGWVSRLCFEPLVGERVLRAMLTTHESAGTITVITGAIPNGVDRVGDRLSAVRFTTAADELVVSGDVIIDATETGELLPLAGAEWAIGSEGRDAFGEPHALPGGPDPRAEQSCTIVAALIRDAVAGDVGPAPARYEELRDAQPFSLTLSNDEGSTHDYAMFDDAVPPGSFWSYRRVRDPRLIGGADTAIINWHGNDYYGSGLTAEPVETDAAARELTNAFVHWLRTEAPRDDGGTGHPELRLAPEVSGTPDGLAESPYVRESRRLRSSAPVSEHDLLPHQGDARARPFADTIGVAWYHADLHPRVGGHHSVYAPTAPFQIPLRSLVAEAGAGPVNLIAGAKNLAATQIAAAAYRVHPGEWAIGEAAGELAAHALRHALSPVAAVDDARHRTMVQVAALCAGAPIVWTTDLPAEHRGFVAGSLLVAYGALDDDRRASLELLPDELLDEAAEAPLCAAAAALADAVGVIAPQVPAAPGSTWADRAVALAAPILAALDAESSRSRPRHRADEAFIAAPAIITSPTAVDIE
ncbi:FAD-dependent oxidoreductase [Agromyces subbeticus]|uniref:FAD-dependent oxidoreductase n=1 Tax=Agromyces subbeticus TaxID=293890 RepID=UPI00146DC726|nr:FAD-dependent oxidoreductase [Agromyces subbeticus]